MKKKTGRVLEMLKRKIYDELLSWKNTKSRECLLVKRVRQIGKTFIIEKFGRDHYASYIYLNFYKNPEYKEIFAGSLDAVQDCPNARTALKFLAIDDRYDVIASGSLLGLYQYNVKMRCWLS